jgi:hypothetical protein
MDVQEDGLRIINPGSPTYKRRQPCGTMGRLEIADGAVRSSVILDLPR